MVIRQARLGDAAAIHRILSEVWGESLLVEVFRDYVTQADRAVLLAAVDGKAEGFISAFFTSAPVSRWEVDLLAVRPRSQGMGIGTALLESIIATAPKTSPLIARAAVRTENVRSQRAFAKAGFETDSGVRKLMLWEPAIGRPQPPANGVTLLPVETLTYRGLWIEGLDDVSLSGEATRTTIEGARDRAAREGRLNTGSLMAEAATLGLESVGLHGAREHGQYHLWTRKLS